MASKLDLPDIGTLGNPNTARAAINTNFTAIENAFDNALSRDGTTPNQMEADIDLNGNDLLNVKRIDATELYKNGVPFEQSVAYANKKYQLFSGTGVQTTYILSDDPGSLGNLYVSVGGADLKPGVDYNYAGTVLTFAVAPGAGTNNIYVRFDKALPTGVTDPDAVNYTPPSTGLAGTVKSFLDALWSTGASLGAALVRYIQTGTGATARTLQSRMRDTLHAADFGVVGDNSTDNSTALANVIAEAVARGGADIILPYGIIRHLSPIVVNERNVMLRGCGGHGFHSGGTGVLPGTALYYTGASAGVAQLTFTSPSGATSQKKHGGGMVGVWLDGNLVAGRGLALESYNNGHFEDVYVKNCTASQFDLGIMAGTLAEAKDPQGNLFINCNADATGTVAGDGWRLNGGAGGNTSFNVFISCGALHNAGIGFKLANCDNNLFQQTRIFNTGGAGASLELQGGATAAEACRSNHFFHLSANAAIIARGTASYASPSIGNTITALDKENSSPDPTIEANAILSWSTDSGIMNRWASSQLAVGANQAQAAAARAAITNESVRIRNAANKHVILDDGTNTWTIYIDASGHLAVIGGAGKFIVPFRQTYLGNGAQLAFDPALRTASATTGASGALPAQVAGYLTMMKEDGTTVIKVPYYNP